MDTNKRIDYQKHWNAAYLKTPVANLGWYEENPTPSLELIEMCNLDKNAQLFNAGAGATTLINKLIKKGYKNIIVNDIAANALADLKESIPDKNKSTINFIVDDLTNPTQLSKLKNIDLWHDRAVLHFFVEENQRQTYFNLVKQAVKVNGYVILAQFNLDGAKKCCGLDVYNYNKEMLQNYLGTNFKLLKAFDYTYTQPSGNTREYVYTLFKKVA
ncbi:MAG TPA: methyltransferase domain-containing protein [Flavobacteriaceae bacterium]|nr:methyltransferase domain-containing protein [Flavobacteriaceae bacterium]